MARLRSLDDMSTSLGLDWTGLRAGFVLATKQESGHEYGVRIPFHLLNSSFNCRIWPHLVGSFMYEQEQGHGSAKDYSRILLNKL